MKETDKINLPVIAKQVVELEKLMDAGIDYEENEQKLTQLFSTLTFTQMLELDDYIIKNKLIF